MTSVSSTLSRRLSADISGNPEDGISLFTVNGDRVSRLVSFHSVATAGMAATSVLNSINSLVRVAGFYANQAAQAVSKGETPSQDGVEVIEHSLRQVSLSVRALLSFQVSRKFDPVLLRFRATVEDIISSLKLTYPENVITLEMCDLHEDCLFVGDKMMLLVLMLNLITNAFDATEGESKKVKVIVGQSVSNEGDVPLLYFSVVDRGKGVTPDIFNKMSEPYVTNKQGLGCIGLGLFIAKMVAEHHGGFLEATTEQGKGSTFTFFVPKYEFQS